jgi:phosphate transport system substrate-binding protein
MLKKVIFAALMATMMMGATAMASDSNIQMGGSSSVYPLAQKLTDKYTQETGVPFHVTFKDSGAGITGVANGTFDIGNASRELTTAEVASGLVATKICQDAVVMIVNPQNPVTTLTKDQVTGIYNGSISNWNQVGGNDAASVVETREAGSGTLDCFTKLFTAPLTSAIVDQGSDGMKAAVAATPNAIGFISMGYVDNSTVYGLQLNGVTASIDTVHDGSYKAVRNFNMVTKGTLGTNVKAFLTWVLSSPGQAIVSADGEIPNASGTSTTRTQRTQRTTRATR